jgi:hypothetical protein
MRLDSMTTRLCSGPNSMTKSEMIMVWANYVIAAGTLVSAVAIFEQGKSNGSW